MAQIIVHVVFCFLEPFSCYCFDNSLVLWLRVFFELLPAADNEGPVDECWLRGGRTQTLHRTPARLQGPQEDRWGKKDT